MPLSFNIQDVIRSQKRLVLEEMNQHLGSLPRTPYQNFLLRTQKGQSRLETWVDLVIDAIDGEFTVFIEDMEKAGYERAIQGFQLANVSDAYQIFLETCLSILKINLSSGNWSNRQLIEEIKSFVKVCFMGYASVAGSFLRTREEIINEKVSFLQKLLDFTRQMITAVDAESVINFASKNISTFFEAEVFLSINRNGKMIHFQNSETAKPNESVARLIKQSFKNTTTVFSDLNGNLSTDIDVSDLKRIIAIPIGAHGRVHGVLALTNYEKGVQFTHKELEMLLQFNYIVAMALEKSFMVEEIEDKKNALNHLSSKVISVGEEQRKLLAADIHDTLAQALAGIGYKIQFCSEMLNNRNDLVENELKDLNKDVDKTIKQTRDIMSYLHPSLIETSGLIPALKKLLNAFKRRNRIKVAENFPENINLNTELSICIYRVVEEAIRNIEKHSEADSVVITISSQDDELSLEIYDNGKGFDIEANSTWIEDPSKFGLLYMRQRVESVSGKFTVITSPNSGCNIKTMIPIKR